MAFVPARQHWWLCSLIFAWQAHAVLIDVPAGGYAGPEPQCKRAFIEKSPFTLPYGIEEIQPSTQAKTSGMLTVRAVYYVPRPVGETSTNDLYTDVYSGFHKRDLAILSKVLHANTVRLGQWYSNSHMVFLRECRKNKLFVIPTFGFSYYVSDTVAKLPFYQREKEIFEAFQKFAINAKIDAEADVQDDLILMWSIDYGLNLNTTVSLGPLSGFQQNAKREEFFALLRVVRQAQWRTDCCTGNDIFNRPLAIEMTLDTQVQVEDVGWYTGFSESVWGVWPTDLHSIGINATTFDNLRKQGAFDVWILMTLPPTSTDGVGNTLLSASQVNSTWNPSVTSGYPWRNVSTQSYLHMVGNFLNNGQDTCDIACSYVSQKMTILQYGFSSQTTSGGDRTLHTDAAIFQEYLTTVWQKVAGSSAVSCAVGGIVLDEWVDDWDRGSDVGCAGSPYLHPQTGRCDQLRPQWTARLEWYGLNGQYTWLWYHCLDPRYNENHPGNTTGLTCSTESGEDTVHNCVFRFDQGEGRWDTADVRFCASRRLSDWEEYVALGLFGGGIIFLLMHCNQSSIGKMCCRWSGAGRREVQDHATSFLPQMGVQDDVPLASIGTVGQLQSTATWSTAARVTAKATVHFRLPEGLLAKPPQAPDFDQITLQIMACRREGESVAKVTDESMRLLGSTHVRCQTNRLWRQLQKEASAVQFDKSAHRMKNKHMEQAVVNLHARVMEGYLAWLDCISQKDLEQREQRLAALLRKGRPMWMLFTEALLLRVVESLSEHLLHAPELIAMLYHEIRWEGRSDSDGLLSRSTHFKIDYDRLHAGIEALVQNTDPFSGGISFDDLNDYGEARIEDYGNLEKMKKTYRESPSWVVVFDLLSNFTPVFTVKSWVFYLSWYFNIGSETEGTEARHGSILNPAGPRVDAIRVFALLDAFVLVVVELMLIVHGVWQRGICSKTAKRGSMLNRGKRKWVLRRTLSFSYGLVGLSALFFLVGTEPCKLDSEDPSTLCHDTETVIICLAYFLCRLVVFIIVTRRRPVPYVSARPSRTEVDIETEDAEEATSDTEEPVRREVPVLSRRSSAVENLSDGSFLNVMYDRAPGVAPRVFNLSRDTTTCLTWFAVLVLCFLFEAYLVVPMAAGFTLSDYCGQSCTPRLYPWNMDLGFTTIHIMPSECCACVLALYAIYLLVLLTTLVDIHYIFFAVNGIGGYVMGERRGLRNVMSTALRYIDLNANMCQQVHVRDLWTAVNDGRAMECVFGNAWRVLWSRTVESMYDDSLVSDALATKMVRAARTVRWRDAEDSKDELVHPGERFKHIRFRGKAMRGASRHLAGSGCCISAIHVRAPNPKSFQVNQVACTKVQVVTAHQHASLLDALDDRFVATQDVPQLGISKGWQLLSGGGLLPNTGETEETYSGRQSFPLELTFTVPGVFLEVVVDMEQMLKVLAVTFSTGHDDPSFDPVRWEIDGSVDGVVWKRLQTQDRDFDLTRVRGETAGLFFPVEPWRVPTISGPTALNVEDLPLPVRQKLCFFTSSLRGILRDREHKIAQGRDTLMDSTPGNIPSLTQVIPVFGEQIILTEEFLRASDGRSANLGFLISQAEDEWSNFAARHEVDGHHLFNYFVSGELREWSDQSLQAEEYEAHAKLQELILDIRLWASNRSQSVARTVEGAIRYHEVLQMLPGMKNSKDTQAIRDSVQLVVAHQTYGNKKFPEESDVDMRSLLWRFREHSMQLVFDYDAEVARPVVRKDVSVFLFSEFKYTAPVRYASVCCEANPDFKEGDREDRRLRIVEVLPRSYALVLNERSNRKGAQKTQGKAGNQLGALRFAYGHYLQMMDANMGAFFGEACKVPFVLRRFQPESTDRALVSARIIGFREHIYTGAFGAVGNAMAEAEWSFGTICQRFLSGLNARMHYGHPDFFDAFWASNRGSVSKASPAINLSEDIFAGFNVFMRGERSKHVDYLEWEKGREVSFNKASQFFTKVASGNVGAMRSRDLKIITENLNISDSFSFYFASVGFYLYNYFVDISMRVYILVFVLLTLSSQDLNDVGEIGSVLAAEWLVSFGVLGMIPRLFELTLEYGAMEGLANFLPSIPSSLLMFVFMNKSVAFAVSSSMQRGDASYVATGRPNANSHYSWRECYFLFAESHYYEAIRIVVMCMSYFLLADDFGFGHLPMILLVIIAVLWFIAPIIFCPQPTLHSIRDDLTQFWNFCCASSQGKTEDSRSVNLEERIAANVNDPRANMYDLWLKAALDHKRSSIWKRLFEFVGQVAILVLMLLSVYAMMLDRAEIVVLFIVVNFFLMALWQVLGMPSILMMVAFGFLCTATVFILEEGVIKPGALLISYIIVFRGMVCLEQAILLLAWVVIRPNPTCGQMPESTLEQREAKERAIRRVYKYDKLVEYLYIYLMSYQWHLYVALVVLAANFSLQLCLALLEALGGLHSALLLNKRLMGGCFMLQQSGFEPKSDAHHSGDTARLLELKKLAPCQADSKSPNVVS